MKQIKTILTAFAVAALAFSCTKEIVVTEDFEAPGTVTVGFTADAINTKAVFGDKDGNAYPVFWSTNDVAPAVTVNYNKDFVQATDFSLSSDRRTANFKGTFSGLTGEQVFIAVTPYSSLKSVSSSDKRINVEIPSGQTNGNGSPDEDAIIGYAVSETFTATPEKVSLSFKHVTAYLHLTIANLSLANGEQVRSVDIISAKDISGRMFFYPGTGATESNSMLKTVSVATNQVADVWAGVAPVDLSNETVTFKVVTDQGTYSKAVTFGTGRTLTRGKAAKFTVDMAGVTREAFETFSLVTDASALHVGDEILIVGAKDDVALSAAQNANNRGVAAVVIDGNKVIAPSDAVQRITLEDGFVPGEYALQVGSGYLYFATGGNNLRTKSAVDATASWDIEIRNITEDSHGTGDIAFIQEKTDGRYIRCNGGDLFSAYVESSGTSYIKIYRKDREADNTPRFNVTLPEGNTVSAAAQTVPVYVFGNVAWTASVTGGATVDKTSGNGNDILTLTVPANTDQTATKSYIVTVTTTASVEEQEFEFNITQSKALGSDPAVGDILFFENWAGSADGATNGALSLYEFGGTQVFGGQTVAYSALNAYTKTDANANCKAASGRDETLLIQPNGWMKVSGIPCKGVKTAILSYVINRSQTNKYVPSSSTEGVTIGSETQVPTTVGGATYYTLSFPVTFDSSKDLSSFDLTITNNHTANTRFTMIQVKVTEVEGGASPTSYGHGGTFGDE